MIVLENAEQRHLRWWSDRKNIKKKKR